jgi:betaine reductase
LEKAGIPVVQITAIPNIAKMVGVNRIVQGVAVPNVVGNPDLDKEAEKDLRRQHIVKALELLATKVDAPTVATI